MLKAIMMTSALALLVSPALAQSAAINAADQKAQGSTVTVQSVTAPADGFIVVHAKDGKILGFAVVKAGKNDNIKVTLTAAPKAGDELSAMLHEDTGQKGSFEFSDAKKDVDKPVMAAGKPVEDKFAVQ
jgi:hypothetical protein